MKRDTMENKELEKNIPAELEDGAQGNSYAGGIAGCANSGEIEDC